LIHAGWSFEAVLELDFDQVELYSMEAVWQQDEFLASLISAINLGNHGKPDDIKRVIGDLTRTKKKPMSADDLARLMG